LARSLLLSWLAAAVVFCDRDFQQCLRLDGKVECHRMLVFPGDLADNLADGGLDAGPFAHGQVNRDDWVEYWPMSAFLGDSEGILACVDLSADCFAGSLADCSGEVASSDALVDTLACGSPFAARSADGWWFSSSWSCSIPLPTAGWRRTTPIKSDCARMMRRGWPFWPCLPNRSDEVNY